ncbi:hypothetical protein DJ568_14715 [Mucilaginibacter hurinus]|uniref:Secretion system C-terminal sorting domain-containing protein n=1 Tax=Mucilaginibacter hurinus TaxID=2201324 RepID=A0A367GLC6_9SPHI|nr:T9SS type A sorting domain-containing protein [Mucilaginibacter hurinus]RCH54130.1 hypothetical protein DJ568_14715 [Mucilaginibacter hurinus]
MRDKYPVTFFKRSILLLLLLSALYLQSNGQNTQRLKFTAITSSQNTGQDYSPWLNDSLDSLVQDAWQNNFVFVDVMLKFKYHSNISQLQLYDWTGVFDDKPAEIYALNGTQKTLLGTFTGPGYNTFQYINLPAPVEADAIIIHKFSNNIPQKIFAYGSEDTTRLTPPDLSLGEPEDPTEPDPTPVPEPDSLTKIPVDVSRWYQLNNVSDGLQGMFDGVTGVDVYTGWGKIFNNYDAYYPVAAGERINLKKIRFFNHTGGLGNHPLTVAVIDSSGNRKTIATYKGGYYNKWLGPYPDRAEVFMLDTALTNIKYIVLNCWYQFPTEIEFYGDYIAPPPPQPEPQPLPGESLVKSYPLKNYLGVNAFEWDFEDGTNPDKVDPVRLTAMRTFTQIRHYMDWEKLESNPGSYTYSPTHSGGWSYDEMYKACKSNNMLVLADLKTLPNWLLEGYPETERDHENVPVPYGADFANPASYLLQAKVAFQYAARYGYNTNVDRSLLSINATPRWTGDPINKLKVGLGYIRYIECDNERDKWWKGRKGYQTAYEYAANLSAFYDGHKNTMGPGVGVKNADPNMKVVMGGLASANPEYVLGMVEWCKTYRGYKADGTVNLCWDVINYHWYSHDAQMIPNSVPTRGVAPELNNTFQKAKDFINVANKYCYGMPVWVTEVGYDANPNSPMRAIPIGNKSILRTQADWILRSSFLYARAGVERIFFYQAYDDNFDNPIQYGSSGLLNQNRTRKPAGDFIYQTQSLLENYTYKQTLSHDPIVDRYQYNGENAYVLYIPDETGRTGQYTLALPGVDSAKIYTLNVGSKYLKSNKVKVKNGQLVVNVSETPVFVLPETPVAAPMSMMSVNSRTIPTPAPADAVKNEAEISVYPSPAEKYVTVAFNTTNYADVNISVADAVMGRVYSNKTYSKPGESFSQTIDISNLPIGVCLVMIKQGDHTIVKRVIKTN